MRTGSSDGQATTYRVMWEKRPTYGAALSVGGLALSVDAAGKKHVSHFGITPEITGRLKVVRLIDGLVVRPINAGIERGLTE